MSSGRLFEDFFPVSERTALITTGEKLTTLDRIDMVNYEINNDRVSMSKPSALLQADQVRLGGLFDNKLVYSCSDGIVGAAVKSKTAHQPFLKDNAVYYTDDWPEVRIYRDDDVFVDHFDDIRQLGNPCWIGDSLYFEARADTNPEKPENWQIWRIRDKQAEFVCTGANPATFNNLLFYGQWNGDYFDYYCTSAD